MKWTSYKGDRVAPVFYGEKIAASELPVAARTDEVEEP
jgi:hypothetical protein